MILKTILKKIFYQLPYCVRYRISYFRIYGKFPKISSPKGFNEKILYRIKYDRNYLYTKLADKYQVREFIKDVIGEKYLIPLVLVTENPEDLLELKDWSHKVIKPNHGAGMVKIIQAEPNKDEKRLIIKDCKNWLSKDFSDVLGEYHYSKIPKKVLVEESICINDKVPTDYKFHCFPQKDGNVINLLQVISERFENMTKTFYLDSLDNPIKTDSPQNLSLSQKEKELLQRAMVLNQKLASYFNYVRIDWYISGDKLYFGELTFTPGAGLSKSYGCELDKQMGKWWCL